MHGVELVAEFFDVFDESADFVVQGPGLIGDQSGIFVLLFVTPDVLDGAQGRQQSGGRHDHDFMFEGVVK